MHKLLARVQKKNSKICVLLVAVGWKLKIGPGFCNPWVTTFWAQNNYFMHSLLARVKENMKFKTLVAVGEKLNTGPGFTFFCLEQLSYRQAIYLSQNKHQNSKFGCFWLLLVRNLKCDLGLITLGCNNFVPRHT